MSRPHIGRSRPDGSGVVSAVARYESALLERVGTLVDERGQQRPLPIPLWLADASTADLALLARCSGPTLDVGCGPGRMTAALTARGTPALGIDISALAVRMTLARGGLALRRDVFDALPGFGGWSTVLLADGNIGIGGDPVALLRRCAALLAPAGSVVLDLEPPGSGLVVKKVRIEQPGSVGGWFRWCWLGVDALPAVVNAAGLAAQQVWANGDRWQARLAAAE